jgi:hypothetical protein
VRIREVSTCDLSRIVAIHNASIPGRMRRDTAPVTVADEAVREFDPARRPLWVLRI